MKKTFQLHIEGKHPDRLLDAIKYELRKYVRRERRRELPENADYWDFDCKFGVDEASAEVVHLATLTRLIDALVQEKGTQFYVEILVKPAQRVAREARLIDSFTDDNEEGGGETSP